MPLVLIINFLFYFSWNHDSMSSMINVLSVKWHSNIYIFPPLPLTNKVITNFISDSVNEDLLITHFWPASSWYSSLRLFLLLLPFPFLQVIFWTKRFFSHSGASSDVAFWLQCSRLFFRVCQSSPK